MSSSALRRSTRFAVGSSRKGDPLYGIRTILLAGAEHLSDRQQHRLAAAVAAHPPTKRCTSSGRSPSGSAPPTPPRTFADCRRIAEALFRRMASCAIPEVARLGRTLRLWSKPILAYFTTCRANTGGTVTVNGLLETASHRQKLSASRR